MRILSRAQAGLPPRTATTRLTNSTGITVHYNGPAMGLLNADLGAHLSRVRNIHKFHTVTRGWLDIAYSFLVCADGTIVEGRGWGFRTAANGTTLGNSRKHAVMVLIGGNEQPTDAQLQAVLDLSAEHRRRYGTTKLVPHHRWLSTSCPGPHLTSWLRRGAPAPSQPTPLPIIAEDADMKLIHLDRRGGTAYVADWRNKRLVPLNARWQADAITGNDDWHTETVVVARADVTRAGWTVG